ncbi:MAG: anaerobic ribonucleoside-triphosphate reductase activating protein [Candidatus Thermoplasmatota archaeon]|nr:anaerobic ribonucleoside-triphosphate reductase activating protein [Candidatus Thermoplasmatota archaeon]
MRIGGFQKTSLLDYPDLISAIIWTVGCNFRCPFCYNRDLVFGETGLYSEGEIFSFLEKRKGLLEGLVITGGEPLLQNDIVMFAEKVKKLGYLIKIDTNGFYPEKLKELIDKKLVDYVAMDVKAPKDKYNQLAGVKTDVSKIEKSIGIIKTDAPDYEFRTTFVPELLKKEDIVEIAKWLDGAKRFYLQQFKNNPPLVSSKLDNVTSYPKEYLTETLETIKPFFKDCCIRGV